MGNYKTYTAGTYKDSDELTGAKQKQKYWNAQNLVDFQYADFADSERTNQFLSQYNNLKAPDPFAFSKQQNWDNNTYKLENMKDFSYDVNGDALYQQYKDQYTNQGKMAMMDTMGQAAAMTGGYGNSYAQSVGQQAYQGYLQQLTDKIPELYQLALSKYNSDRDNLYKMNDLYQNLYNNEYGKHRNDVDDYHNDRSHLADMWSKSHTADMDTYTTNRDTALAENESHNKNITDNRNTFNGLVSDLATREWNQYTDKEKIAQAAIDMYNSNVTAENELSEKKRQFDKQYEASTGYTVDGQKSTLFTGNDGGEDFQRYTYAGVDADGNSRFYRDGKEYTVERGVNPYTGTKNPDAKYGTFGNGYQPKKITVDGKVKELSSVEGLSAEVNGVTQKVWTTDGGKTYYVWDGTKNRYEDYTDEAKKKLATMKAAGLI